MSRRCPLHDETLDPDTGHCDHCQRDARLDCDTLDLDQMGPGTVVRLDARNDEQPWNRPEAEKVTRTLWRVGRSEGLLDAAALLELATWQGVDVLHEGEWITHPTHDTDMPEETYHGDPVLDGSLSVSRAKILLQPGGPARYLHQTTHGRPDRPEFDLGHAAHALVLGKGAPIRRIPYDDLRTKAAKEAVTQARLAGETPLKPREYDQVKAMAAQLEATPGAVEALAGEHEVSAFTIDPETGVWLRGRFDAIGEHVGDYKTAVSADPDVFARKAYEFGYDMQAAWYSDLATALPGLPDDPRFLFVVQEKTAPYLVSVIELDDDYLAIGRDRCRQAIDLYHACLTADEWPGYPAATVTVAPPRWLTFDSQPADTEDPLDPDIEAAFADILKGTL